MGFLLPPILHRPTFNHKNSMSAAVVPLAFRRMQARLVTAGLLDMSAEGRPRITAAGDAWTDEIIAALKRGQKPPALPTARRAAVAGIANDTAPTTRHAA